MPTAFNLHRLRMLRLEHDYLQKDVAEILGLSRPEYSRMENGQVKLNSDHIALLVDFYQVAVCDLFTEQEDRTHG